MNARSSACIVCIATLGSTLLTATSCLQETPGHCAFAKGNASCEQAFAGTFCIFQGPGFLEHARLEYRNVSEAQRLGCYESPPMMDGPERQQPMVPEYYGCVPDGLTNEDEWRVDLRELAKGGLTLRQFLEDHGVPDPEEGCPTGSGTTTDTSDTGTSDSGTTTTGMESSTTDGEGSESSTTGPMPCMGNEACTSLEAPQCIGGECMACVEGADGDAACDQLDSTRPLCAGGICVQCTEHEQCSSGACELAVGLCFPGDFVVHVDGDGGADYTSIGEAVVDVPDDTPGVIVVHELDDGAEYGRTLIDGSDKTIALLAAPDESPIIQGNMGDPGLRVSGMGMMVYVDGLTIAGNTSGLGLRVDFGAHAWVDRSRIVQNAGGGIRVDGAAELTLRNCFVGSDVNDAHALEVDGATATVLYSTLGGGTFNASALTCTNPMEVEVRNSILVTRGGMPPDEVDCAANISHSVTEGDVAGEDNVMVGMFPSGSPGEWFVGYTMGNFHLQGNGLTLFDDVAEWQTGDPTTDIDGDARPEIDGTPGHAGADVP